MYVDEYSLVRYDYVALLRIRDILSKAEKELDQRLDNIRSQQKTIDQILISMKGNDETFGAFLPKSFFEIKNESITRGVSKKFNWKTVALDLITDYDGLVTTDMVYEMARIKYPIELPKRPQAIRNFSSALYYLAQRDGKLIRYKKEDSREYIYGLWKHFDELGKTPKKEAVERFARQSKKIKRK